MEYLTLTIECETIRVSISSGSILFSSNPPGADIYLIVSGGIPVNIGLQTPNTIPDLPIGDYDYILKLSGYKDYTGTVTVIVNDTSLIIVDLIPIPTIAPVLVATGTVSVLGLLLATTTKSAITITTGKLGGEIIAVKL